MCMRTRRNLFSAALLACGLAALVVTWPRPVPALAVFSEQSGGAITLTARAGFDGYYRSGQWLPVRVTIANNGPDRAGVLQIATLRSSGGSLLFVRPLDLPAHSRREFFMYVMMEVRASSLNVELKSGNQILASVGVRLMEVAANDLLYGVVAGSPSAYAGLAGVGPVRGAARVAQLSPADLPSLADGWQALDVLVFSDVDTGSLSPEQRSALSAWLMRGGCLIVAGGAAWQKTTAGLSGLLPLELSGTRSLTDLTDLDSFAYASPAPAADGVVAAVGTLKAEAIALARSGNVVLLAVRQMGCGQVFFLAVDPAFAPLKGWDGFAGLFRYMLSYAVDCPYWGGGFTDWSSAATAIATLPGLELPSIFLICGFLGLYLIIIGPLNYLILWRLKRREWAWLTIPAIVLVFSGVSYVVGYYLRGTNPTLHRLTVVHVWPESDRAQVDALIGLFSPRRATYDIKFPEGFLVRPLPEGYNTNLTSVTIEQSAASRLARLPVEIGMVEAFVAQGQAPAPLFEADLVREVAGGDLKLKGSVTNRSDIALTDVVLLAPGNVMRLGNFQPGETKTISLTNRNVEAIPLRMTDRKIVAPQFTTGSGISGGYNPGYYYDSTVDDILGAYNYDDRKQYRRNYMLSALRHYSYANSRGGSIYLAGWAETTPALAEIAGRPFDLQDETIYFIALRPEPSPNQAEISLGPGLMNWLVDDPDGTIGSPYNVYLENGYDFAVRFAPLYPLAFHRVRSLTLHLRMGGTYGSAASVEVSLWDFAAGVWEIQPHVRAGDNIIPEAARFVGPGGEIFARVVNPGQALDLQRLDFTLVVER